MNRTLRTPLFALTALALLVGVAEARKPEVPAASPPAEVSQVVGVTEIAVEYSSPGVKGREIYGGLVPYDELWRTGANMATRITFSKDVTIAGETVPAGSYSLFTIPKEGGDWTVILNKVAALPGTRGYDEGKDQLRFTAKTETIPKRERMTFLFADTTPDTTSLDLEWDTLRVRIPITIDTTAYALANVDEAVKEATGTLANAARYLLEQKKDLPRALGLADASLSIEPSFYAAFIKARILKEMGRTDEAVAAAKRARELGEKAPFFFWKDQVEEAISTW